MEHLKLDTIVRERVEAWLSDAFDKETNSEIERLITIGDATELTDSFYRTLEFGTGGLRGIMGVGTNRMNKYTVGMATQGLANYILKTFDLQPTSVAIAHDSRNKSKFFAKTAADILSANGIKVFLFEDLRPTPELSFAVRHFNCNAGIVVTASHNPKEYNGYKVYWKGGAQVVPPHDENIIAEVNKITSPDQVKFNGNETLIEYIGKAVDEKYIEMVKGLSVNPDVIKRQHDLKIVFSPLHGTGVVLLPPTLDALGFTNYTVVAEQATPDGNFPTVVYPNPEEAEANTMAVNKAKELDADVVISTDPDADRVGVAVKDHHNQWTLLTGNQTATLLYDYILSQLAANNKLTGSEFTVKTIVTTDILAKISAKYNVESFDVLTGFKYIAEIIGDLEGERKYLVGGEESYGYLVGDSVRDKDAIASAAMIAELVAFAKDKGYSVFERLIDIYIEFGYFREKLISLTRKGKSGAEEIQKMMADLRANPPKTLGGSTVVKMADYKASVETNLVTGEKKDIPFPKSNVLQFFTEDETKITARPSGTEPKIKFYFGVKGQISSRDQFDAVTAQLDDKVKGIIAELNL